MAKTKRLLPPLPVSPQYWLIISLTVAAIPHFIYQPFWVFGLFAVMMAWRVGHLSQGWPLPEKSRWLKLLHGLGAIFTIGLIVQSYEMTIGRDAGVALLTVMLAFKVVELKTPRDFYLSSFLGFFLVITNFFYTQSIAVVLLMFVAVIVITASLISLNQSTLSIKQKLTLSSTMLVQALPMMLILFVLFPRIPGPIWGLPNDATTAIDTLPDGMTLGDSSGISGISGEMTVGRISQLIQSDAIAFRVAFEDNRYPAQRDLYWRGPVLWQTDGTQWQALPQEAFTEARMQLQVQGTPFHYTSTLEPHRRNWLFALDFPQADQQANNLQMQADGVLTHQDKLTSRTQVRLTSYSHYQLNPQQDALLEAGLQLPAKKHPQARQLALELRQQAADEQDYVDKVLQHFNQDPFRYTLTPPALYGDTVDQFLFESQSGFCEHYAASFTVLMRAAGIPARVVTGYLGGEVNPISNLLVVRQRDAHAWAEVWLANHGWVRVDPTAAVASERVDQGISQLLPANRRAPAMLLGNQRLLESWQALKNNWEAINSTWDLWVVAYGPDRQMQLLRLLGMNDPNWQKMIVWLSLAIAAIFLAIALLMLWQRPLQDKQQRYYQLFCRRLQRLGVDRQPAEGPQDFARRAAAHCPQYQQRILTITDQYMRLRYRNDTALEQEFIQQVKQFRTSR